MRFNTKAEGDALAKKIAAHVCSRRADKNIIVADKPESDTKDEAKQSAISYWMMGWTWDEIETILEDSEYNKAVVSYAMKEAKEYAKKVLNDGPFAVLTSGQGIRLINGEVGALEEKHADHVTVALPGQGRVKIMANQIDTAATNKLSKAFELRKESATMIEGLPELKQVALKTASANVVQSHLDSALSKTVNTLLSTIAAVSQDMDEVIHGYAAVQTALDSNKEQFKLNSECKLPFAQYVAAIIHQEGENYKFIGGLLNQLNRHVAMLHDSLAEFPDAEKDLQSYLSAYIRSSVFPIVNNISAHLTDSLQNKIAATEHISTPNAAAVDWARMVWENTKVFEGTLEEEIAPAVELAGREIAGYLFKSQKSNRAAKIASVIQNGNR